MKKSEAQTILTTTALGLLVKEVGEEAAKEYTVVLGRYEAATHSHDTAEKVEGDEGWTVIAIPIKRLEMVGSTVQCNGTRVIDTYAHSPGYSTLGSAGTVVAAIWQWGAD